MSIKMDLIYIIISKSIHNNLYSFNIFLFDLPGSVKQHLIIRVFKHELSHFPGIIIDIIGKICLRLISIHQIVHRYIEIAGQLPDF